MAAGHMSENAYIFTLCFDIYTVKLQNSNSVCRQDLRYYLLSFTAAAKTIGVNPKINNMNQGYKAAKYDLLWICDSNIRGMFCRAQR